MKNTVIGVAVVLALLVGGYFISSLANSNSDNENEINANEVVATVNGEEIFGRDLNMMQIENVNAQGIDITMLDEAALAQLRTQSLDTLISQTLLRQEISKHPDLTLSGEEITEQLDEIKAQFPDDATYEAALAEQGMTQDELQERLISEMLMQAYFDKELGFQSISASDEDITTMYDQVAAGGGTLPPLEDIRDQVEGLIIQQKQQELVTGLIDRLRTDANVQVLI